MRELRKEFVRIDPGEGFADLQKQLHQGGAFLVSVDTRGRPNAMTIGWALLGTTWYRPTLLILVRPSRYTHECLLHSGEFTVNVPLGKMAKELAFCGEKSGRDLDKFKELRLRWEKGEEISVPILIDCDLIYECRVVAWTGLAPEQIPSQEVRTRYYSGGNLHTLFLGEILAAWRAQRQP